MCVCFFLFCWFSFYLKSCFIGVCPYFISWSYILFLSTQIKPTEKYIQYIYIFWDLFGKFKCSIDFLWIYTVVLADVLCVVFKYILFLFLYFCHLNITNIYAHKICSFFPALIVVFPYEIPSDFVNICNGIYQHVN